MVSLNYVLCTAPRTGSTLLAEALTSTGRAGRPNEFFDIYDYNERFWRRTLGIGSDADYVDRVLDAGTTANGVFGVKLLWHQMPAILAKLRASLDGGAGDNAAGTDRTLHHLLSQKIGEPRYLWLRRQNKLTQAISYYRASRTGLWRSVDTRTGPSEIADRELPFDFPVIEKYLTVVNQFDENWHAYFSQHRVKVLMITYENFVQSYESTVRGVLDFLEIDRDGVTIAPPRLQRQADRRSEEWERRFLDMRKAAATVPVAHPSVPAAESDTTPALPKSRRAPPKRIAAPREEPPLPLIAYSLSPHRPTLVTAKPNRDWMDATPKRFAYRCLPMVMANQAGWLILNRHKLAVTWNGGIEPTTLKIDFLSGENPRSAVSIFGSGVLTFMVGYLFRTPPGYNLYVHGPANSPKDGVVALEGIVESDWTESTFTMNWKVTRPNHPIVFEADEPIAMVTPMPRHQLERFDPVIRNISEDPELEALHKEWASSRQRHNAELGIPNSPAQKAGWQRHYMRGTSIRKEPAPEHQTGLALNDFIDKRT